MKAAILKDTGSADQMTIKEIPTPAIKENEILIKTEMTSINPIEIKTRDGNRFSPELLKHEYPILGWDASGVVEKIAQHIICHFKYILYLLV